MLEKDVDLNEEIDLIEDKTTNMKVEVKVIDESSRSLSFRERMKHLGGWQHVNRFDRHR